MQKFTFDIVAPQVWSR